LKNISIVATSHTCWIFKHNAKQGSRGCIYLPCASVSNFQTWKSKNVWKISNRISVVTEATVCVCHKFVLKLDAALLSKIWDFI